MVKRKASDPIQRILQQLNSPLLACTIVLELTHNFFLHSPRRISKKSHKIQKCPNGNQEEENGGQCKDVVPRASFTSSSSINEQEIVQECQEKFCQYIERVVRRLYEDATNATSNSTDVTNSNLELDLSVAIHNVVERCVRFMHSKMNPIALTSGNLDDLRTLERLLEKEIDCSKRKTLLRMVECLETLVKSRLLDKDDSNLYNSLYEAYHLEFATKSISGVLGLKKLLSRVEEEFVSCYFGGNDSIENDDDDSSKKLDAPLCRVNGCLMKDIKMSSLENDCSPNVLFLQINIGNTDSSSFQTFENDDEKNEILRKNRNSSYICYNAVIKPETSIIVLSTSLSTKPSKSALTRFVLSAITNAMCDVIDSSNNEVTNGSFGTQIIGLEGTNPLNLLRALLSSDNKSTLGRFASVTNHDLRRGKTDALIQLHQATTYGLSEIHLQQTYHKGNDNEENRQTEAHADYIKHASNQVASLVGVGKRGTIVDMDSAKKVKLKKCRINDFGEVSSSHKFEKLSFKWSGPASVVGTNEEESSVYFKCGIVFEGSNVLAGLQALVDKGVAKAPLPDFIKDAPMTSSGIISVVRPRLVTPKDAVDK